MACSDGLRRNAHHLMAMAVLIVSLCSSSSHALLGNGQWLRSRSATTAAGYHSTSLVEQRQLMMFRRKNSKRSASSLSNLLSIRRGGSISSSSNNMSTTEQLQSKTNAATAAVVGLMGFLDSFLKANPLIAAAIVCATKASLADLVAQQMQQKKSTSNTATTGDDNNEGKNKFDFRRTLSFMVYGAFYQGMAQELIYNNFYTFLFGSATTLRVAVKKVLFDAVFHNALVCIPMAYVVKAFVFQHSLLTGIRQYIDDVLHHGLLLKYYALWMPVNAMIFTIVPTHWRISVMAVVSFFWMIILSTIASRSRED